MDLILRDIKLSILVFGPSPAVLTGVPADDVARFSFELAKKRVEIRDALSKDGHDAQFPEDLVKGAIDPAVESAYLFEEYLVRRYDMVVNLVGSIGSATEMALFMRDNLARKAALYFNGAHTGGLAYSQGVVLRDLGATLETYTYPIDLTACNLMTTVRVKVRAVQLAKFYYTGGRV